MSIKKFLTSTAAVPFHLIASNILSCFYLLLCFSFSSNFFSFCFCCWLCLSHLLCWSCVYVVIVSCVLFSLLLPSSSFFYIYFLFSISSNDDEQRFWCLCPIFLCAVYWLVMLKNEQKVIFIIEKIRKFATLKKSERTGITWRWTIASISYNCC